MVVLQTLFIPLQVTLEVPSWVWKIRLILRVYIIESAYKKITTILKKYDLKGHFYVRAEMLGFFTLSDLLT